MRIDGMDAKAKMTANIAPVQARQETVIDPEKLQPLSGKQTTIKDPLKTEVSDDFVKKAIDKVNFTFEIENRSLRFKIHERLNEVMVKVIDSETKEVIREIPPEKLLDMFANMLELAGLLVDERR